MTVDSSTANKSRQMESEETRGSDTKLQDPEPDTNQQPTRHQNSDAPKSEEEEGEGEGAACNIDRKGESKTPSFNEGKEILKAIEVVERDSVAIAQSFTSVFASLRLALSQVTSTSVDHMSCFSDAAGRLQESVLDAATKGNRYINSCLRLNEEMKGIDNLASQLKVLRRNVDAMDSAVNRMTRFP